MTSSLGDLLSDLLDDLRGAGVQLLPWDEVDETTALDVQAVAFPAVPDAGLPAQVYLRPATDLHLAVAVARDVQRRLKAEAAGDPNVFQSFEPTRNRKVALIYGHME